jgi:hypothetical protein
MVKQISLIYKSNKGVFVKKILGLLILIGFLFSACAPAIPGSSRYSPIDARGSDAASITAGPEWFVKTLGLIWLVDRATVDDALDPLFTSESDLSVGTVKTFNVNWLEVQDIKAPTGWVVELAAQQAVRRVTRAGPTRGTYYASDSLELVWLVKVPPSTAVGEYTILALLKNRSDSTKVFPVNLDIEVSQAKN